MLTNVSFDKDSGFKGYKHVFRGVSFQVFEVCESNFIEISKFQKISPEISSSANGSDPRPQRTPRAASPTANTP